MDRTVYEGADSHLTPADYKKALLTQSACNASGLIISLSEVMGRIREENRQSGTDWCNRHPIVQLYLCQLAHLAGGPLWLSDLYTWALGYCTARAEAEAHGCAAPHEAAA